MYEDKTATLLRIKETITTLLPQNVRDRLVLENDEVRVSIYLCQPCNNQPKFAFIDML